MKPEELMKPRYKVIADWPGCNWDVGQILIHIGNGNFDCKEAPTISGLRNPENYPSNLNKMQWWEERAIDDMPEYVKVIREDCIDDTGLYCKVFRWTIFEDKIPTIAGQFGAELEGYTPLYLARTELNFPGQVYGRLNATHLEPATREEYEQYKQSL
jgi:hypothetical protein